MKGLSPYQLMYTLFEGMGWSLVYGLSSSLALYTIYGFDGAISFLHTYTTSFNTMISLGLGIGTALVVFRNQNIIPETVEAAFSAEQLKKTQYFELRGIYFSRQRSMIWSSEVALGSFLIFLLCKFPPPMLAENLMILAACSEYALGVYVGRKLFRSGLMLHSLLEVAVNRNLFKKQELDEINSYVNVVSSAIIIFGYVHVENYYNGPFLFNSPIGESARALLVAPAILATPVLLIFNFYPRMVLRKIYSQSIDIEIGNLRKQLSVESLSIIERLSFLIEFEKQSRDELRHRLRLALSDLPLGIAIFLLAIRVLIGK